MIPGVICLALIAFGIALIVSKIEKKHGAGTAAEVLSEEKEEQNEKKQGKKGIYVFNLILTLAMLVLLFMDTPLPLYSIFMIAFAIALIVNYPNAKQQNKKIKEYGTNAMVMTVTLFSVGVFMGVIKDSGMVEAMANTIVAVLPSAIAPHMHWFMCLFSVPLLMVLGTDAFLLCTASDHHRCGRTIWCNARNSGSSIFTDSNVRNTSQPIRSSRLCGTGIIGCIDR